jgi:hypothetical protein
MELLLIASLAFTNEGIQEHFSCLSINHAEAYVVHPLLQWEMTRRKVLSSFFFSILRILRVTIQVCLFLRCRRRRSGEGARTPRAPARGLRPPAEELLLRKVRSGKVRCEHQHCVATVCSRLVETAIMRRNRHFAPVFERD